MADLDQTPVQLGPAPCSASMTPPASADGEKRSSLAMSDLSSRASASGSAVGPPDDDIQPHHYYGGGRIPVFQPTMDQFRDFSAFVRKVDRYGMQSGIVKIIPPKEWSDALPPLDDAVKSIRVKNPIMQEFHGSHGTYTQANIEKQRSYNLPQWKALCEESSHQPPARRGERRRNYERATHPRKSASRRLSEMPAPVSEPVVKSEPPPDEPPTPVSPEHRPVVKAEDLSDGEPLPAAPKSRGRQPRSRKPRSHRDGSDDDEAFAGFDYRLPDTRAEFPPDRCDELETAYWKSLMYNNPLYGADLPGSLFDDSTQCWNVAKLPNLLDVLGQNVPGVNTSYLYLGMWKASFAWHLEDVDLYSINYIHFGAPKQWYSISQEDAGRFEAAMKSIWPADAKNCDQFLRHKTYFISPSLLKSQFDITVNKMVHYEGEFVITYPYGYHSGYNLGYNCAESVNFATEKWLDYARVARKCNCEPDSVWIDINEIERKLRGEATPDHDDDRDRHGYGYEDDDDDEEDDDDDDDDDLASHELDEDGTSDMLTPPRSIGSRAAVAAAAAAGQRARKRKRHSTEGRGKRLRLHQEPRPMPCVLCPNDLDYEELLSTEDGQSRAHRRCALYVEETTILPTEDGREVVCDVDKIPKARLGLKCLYCREVRGACFQCMYGKCTRAYHPTCALLAGVQAESGQLAVLADDGREYAVPAVDLKCRYHRPRRAPCVPADALESDPKLLQTAVALRPGDLVQFQVDREICGASVLENRPAERALLLRVLPRGDVIELPYRWLLVIKKSSFLPLSTDIKPLPPTLARRPEARQDLASSVPSHGTPFGDARFAHQWAEFLSSRPPFNAATTSVDLTKPEQIWYYLGPSSTECRAQYTDNPGHPAHNPRSHFLESVKSLNAPVGGPAGSSLLPPAQAPVAAAAAATSAAAVSASVQRCMGVGMGIGVGGVGSGSATPVVRKSSLAGATAAAPPRPPPQPQPPQPALQVPHAQHQPSPLPHQQQQYQHQHQQSPPQQSSPFLYQLSPSSLAPLPLPPSPLSAVLPPTLPQPDDDCPNNEKVSSDVPVHVRDTHNIMPGWASDLATQLTTARRLVASITDHANLRAGYTIVNSEFAVRCLLGPAGSVTLPANGMEKLRTAMAESEIQLSDGDGQLLPPRPLDMEADEVDHLLRMLRFAIINLTAVKPLEPTPSSTTTTTRDRETESPVKAKLPSAAVSPQPEVQPPVALKTYFELQHRHVPTVYRSPYAPGGFSEYAKHEYELEPIGPPPPRPSMAVDYFEAQSPEDQARIVAVFGRDATVRRAPPPRIVEPEVKPEPEPGAALDPQMDMDEARFGGGGGLGPGSALDAMVMDSHAFDLSLLHAGSPAESFGRPPLHDFTDLSGRHVPGGSGVGGASSQQGDHDHGADLFGDQQANTRFWARHGPWLGMGLGLGLGLGAESGGETPDHRPFFGPEPRPSDYAPSDMDLGTGKGPGSLHSVDMAAFGFDAPDDIYQDLASP